MGIKTLLRSLRKHQVAISADLSQLAKEHGVSDELVLALNKAMPEPIAEAAMDVVEKALAVKEDAKAENAEGSGAEAPKATEADGKSQEENAEENAESSKGDESAESADKPADKPAATENSDGDATPSGEEAKAAFKSFEDVLAKSGFKHKLNAEKGYFEMHYDAKIGSASIPDFDTIVKAAGFQKSGTDFTPTDSEFQKILALTPRKNFTKDDFKVYPTVSAGTAVDSHSEHFSVKALGNMSKTGNGNPFLKDHVYKADNVIGNIIDGQVATIDGEKYLVQKVAVRNTPENKALMDGLESFNNKLSVGVRIKYKDYICDICDKAMYTDPAEVNNDWSKVWCGHQAGSTAKVNGVTKTVTATINDASQHELSQVALGAQACAAIKTAKSPELSTDNVQKSDSSDVIKDAIQKMSEIVASKSKPVQKSDEQPASEGDPAPSEVDKENGDTEQGAALATIQPTMTAEADKQKTDPTLAELKFGETEMEELKALIAAQAESNNLLKQLVDVQTAANAEKSKEVEALKEALAAKDAQFDKQLAETRELAKLTQVQFGAFVAQSNKLLNISVDEFAIANINSREKDKTLNEEDAAKDKDGTKFYTSLSNRIVGQ
jgi:hypothetical protein